MKWKKGQIMSSKVFLLMLLDILTIQIASFLGLFIRYEFSFNSIPVSDMEQVLRYTVPNTIITLIVFAVAKMYRSVWRHASSSELVNIILGNAAASAIQVTCACLLKLTLREIRHIVHPRSVNIIKLEGQRVSDETIQGTTGYFITYVMLLFGSFILVSIDNYDFTTSITAVITTLGLL